MTEAIPQRSTVGWLGFGLGAVSLLAAIFLFQAGPFAPQQSAGVTIGELAAEIGQSALRKVTGGESPPGAPIVRTIDDYLSIGVGLLAGLAVVTGLLSFMRHERKRVAFAGVALGATTILFQFFIWYAIMLAFVLLIGVIMHSMGDFFDGLFS